jgi:hypothetical protein
MAKVEQGEALEHPRRRGHPPGMWVEAIAHRSFLPTGKAGETGSAAAFSDELRAPAVGGSPVSGWRGRGSSAQQSTEKKRQGGVLGAPLTVEEFATTEAAGQRRRRARTEARRSDSDVVGFGHGGQRGQDRRARGEATARLGQRRGAVGTALSVGAFMARRGRMAATWQWHADRRARRGKRRLTGGSKFYVNLHTCGPYYQEQFIFWEWGQILLQLILKNR